MIFLISDQKKTMNILQLVTIIHNHGDPKSKNNSSNKIFLSHNNAMNFFSQKFKMESNFLIL